MNEIEQHILDLIGENSISPDVFTSTSDGMEQIRDSINDAIEEISLITGCSKADYHLPLKANVNFYRIDFRSAHLGWFTDVWHIDRQFRLEQTDFIGLIHFNQRWLKNVGSPERYCPVGHNMICLHPAPSADAGMLHIKAVVIPKRYELDTDRIRLREKHQWAAAYYAVSEFYASRVDAKAASTHHGFYLQELGVAHLYPESSERIYQYRSKKWTGENS